MIVLRELAPAKVNLYLQVTGKRDDGYHLLDSLVAFADVHDKIEVSPADSVTFAAEGPFASGVPTQDNIVIRAAESLRTLCKVKAGATLRLHKHLPVGAGLGGGSSDAAATLRLLARFWKVKPSPKELHTLALSLGADVPVCLRGSSSYMSGIGETIEPGPVISDAHGVLIWPGMPLLTKDVFGGHKAAFSSAPRHPHAFASHVDMIEFLGKTKNDLQATAVKLEPHIKTALTALAAKEGCEIARMSGSGTACFGIFITRETAAAACAELSAQHPSWWVKPVSFR